MKIGILTYHRSHNYGALLQAVALRKALTSIGCDVTFIDYWPEYHQRMYLLFSFHKLLRINGLKGKIKYIVTSFIYRKERKLRILGFQKFIQEFIDPYASSVNEDYDIIIYGSDQIWRKQLATKEYDPVYFGDNSFKANKHISYAASMGILPGSEHDKKKIKSLLSHLHFISVREKELESLVKNLGYYCYWHIDPTLLLSSKEWESLIHSNALRKPDDKYILYYHLTDSFNINEIRKFADSQHLKLKIIYGTASRKDTEENFCTANPLTFINMIKDAEYVFTSSFHGLVFALLFHKPFYASYKKNSGRASSLLNMLNLSNRLIEPHSAIKPINNPINYAVIDQTLNILREEAIKYLEQHCK